MFEKTKHIISEISWSFLQYCKCNGKYKNAHIKKGKVLCQMNTCGKV